MTLQLPKASQSRHRTATREAGARVLLVAVQAISLLLLVPQSAWSVCGGGGTSLVPAPQVTFLRTYRPGFNAPTRVALDTTGNIYVTDPVRHEVVVRSPSGRLVSRTTMPGRPVSVAVGRDRNVYVGDADSGSVTAFDAGWQPTFQLGQGSGEFVFPADIGVAQASGDIYVADAGLHLVKRYGADGTFRGAFGGPGAGDGQLRAPVALFVDDAAGEILVTDQLNFRIQVFDLDGVFRSCFGRQGNRAGQFNVAQGLWRDIQGRTFVADGFEGRVQVLDRGGNFIANIGDFGDRAGEFRVPIDVAIDANNRLFVAVANNARLEVFGLDAFTDPETVVPAVLELQPDPIDRQNPPATVVGYLEVPGHSLQAVVAGTVLANGVPANSAAGEVGDRDGDGEPDLPLDFDAAALLATVSDDGESSVVVSGRLGDLEIEALGRAHVISGAAPVCDGITPCPLGEVDPRCAEAVCVEPVGCVVRIRPGDVQCDDGDPCTTEDLCSGGVCTGGPPPRCDDGNSCTDEVCAAGGVCTSIPNAAPCEDGDPCTSADTCSRGACVSGAQPTCDDGNQCTDDTCAVDGTCGFTPNATPCEDGDPCTGGDRCSGGACVSGTQPTCDDGNPCTDDTCVAAGSCSFTANAAPCDDRNPCTTADLCREGQCTGGSLYVCTDGNACTVDTCEPPSGCLFSSGVKCDDGNDCTDDACDPAAGCTNVARTGVCDDGDAGTARDACDLEGNCVGSVATGEYAVLQWSAGPGTDADDRVVKLARGAVVQGGIGGVRIAARGGNRINGDAVSSTDAGAAIVLGPRAIVDGDAVTAGGSIRQFDEATIGGRIDTTGTASELLDLAAASQRALTRWADFSSPVVVPTRDLGAIRVGSRGHLRIPDEGVLGPGRVVVDMTELRLLPFATLTIAADPGTDPLIIRVRGPRSVLRAERSSAIVTEGVAPERIIFVVDGPVRLRQKTTLAGTVFTNGPAWIGRSGTIEGAVVAGGIVFLYPGATVDRRGFTAW